MRRQWLWVWVWSVSGCLALPEEEDTDPVVLSEPFSGSVTGRLLPEAPFSHDPATALWQLAIRSGTDGTISWVDALDPGLSGTLTEQVSGTMSAVWSGTPDAWPSGTIEVTVISVPAGDGVEATILVDLQTGEDVGLFNVQFPRITLGTDDGDASGETLALPLGGGVLVRDPALAFLDAPVSLPYPGDYSAQFLAYYHEGQTDGPMYFFGTRDSTGYLRRFVAGGQEDEASVPGLFLAIDQIPEDNTTTLVYRSPYPAYVEASEGDWYDAAMSYRDWALEQPWMARGRLVSDGGFPAQIRDTDTFGAVGPILSDPVDDDSFDLWSSEYAVLATELGIESIGSLAYGWNSLTLLEQESGDWGVLNDAFAANTPALVSAGHPVHPYTQVESLLETSERFVQYEYAAILNIDGEYAGNDYLADLDPDGNAVQYVRLCHGTQAPTDYALWLQDLVAPSGANGQYLDVSTYSSSIECYNPAHGHPLGGGNWFAVGKNAMFEEVLARGERGVSGFALSSEAVGELYIPHIPLVYNHHYDVGAWSEDDELLTMAPIYNAIYNGYQVIGAVKWLNDSTAILDASLPFLPSARRMIGANAFMGHTPYAGSALSSDPNDGVSAHLETPEYADYIAFAGSTAAVVGDENVQAHMRFGERLRDPGVSVTTIEAGAELLLPYGHTQPLVYVSAWRDPDVGTIGLLLSNWTADGEILEGGATGGTVSVEVSLDRDELGLYGDLDLVLIDGDTATFAGTWPAALPLLGTLTVPPLTTFFVALVP